MRATHREEEDDDLIFLTSRPYHSPSRSTTLPAEDETVTVLFDDQVIDLTLDDAELLEKNVIRKGEHILLSVAAQSGSIVRREDFVEVISSMLGRTRVDFIHVSQVIRDTAGNTKVRGVPFVRSKSLRGKLPDRLNEVCMIHHIHRGANGQENPILLDVDPKNVIKKRTLVFTNKEYPMNAHVPSEDPRRNKITRKAGNLVCRWRMKVYFTVNGTKSRPDEEVMERLHATEVREHQYWSSQASLSFNWRGTRHKGGSWRPGVRNIHSAQPENGFRSPGQKYSFFDSFAGAGGASRGAERAGLKVSYAVDKSPEV